MASQSAKSIQVGGTGAEGAHVGGQVGRMVCGRRRRIFGRHGDPVHVGMDVNAGSMRVGHMQRLGCTGGAPFALDSHGVLHNRKGLGQRPRAREGVKSSKFPNGDTHGAPPMMSPQAPGTKLTVGHEAPINGRPPRPAASYPHHKRWHPPATASRSIPFLSVVSRRGRVEG